MHILKIIHGYPPDYNAGSEVYSQSICNELSQQGHQVSIFTREQNDYRPDFEFREEIQSNLQRIIRVNLPREKDGYQHPELDTKFRMLVQQLKPDVAHIGHLNHLSTGIIDVLFELHIPTLFTLHDFWLMCPRGQFLQRNFDQNKHYELCHKQEDKTCAAVCYRSLHTCDPMNHQRDIDYWTNWIEGRMQVTKQLTEKVDLFLAPSQYLRNRFIDDFGIPAHKVIYLDYGFPIHYLQPVEWQPRSVFTFGYIGTHIPAKGINHLIEAFSKIQQPAKLIIWGRERGQNTRALKEMASCSINEIEFRGEYVNKNIAQLVFSHVDAIVVPSIWGENSPLVIHEAQACKIPVITANLGGMKEYVHHKVNGLLFEHRDPISLQQQLEYAITHPDELIRIGARGYLLSEDRTVPDIKTHCHQLIQYYKKIQPRYV